jgi:hypothetical protein
VALAASLYPGDAQAEPVSRFRLGLGLGITRFAVQTGAPPPCCREREQWKTLGPELSVRGSVELLSWLHAGLDAGVGLWIGGDRSLYRDLDVILMTLRFTPHVGLSFGREILVRPRLGMDFLSMEGTYIDPSDGVAPRKGSTLLAPHLGLAVVAPLGEHLEVGGDLGGFWLDAWAVTARGLVQARFLRVRGVCGCLKGPALGLSTVRF